METQGARERRNLEGRRGSIGSESARPAHLLPEREGVGVV
jgi:hypothetical protein